MGTPIIQSIDALFTRGRDECTRLSITREEDLTFAARGVCSRTRNGFFPIHELVERHARAGESNMQELFAAFEEAELDTWYHHYGRFDSEGAKVSNGYPYPRWGLRITYQDESTRHWEGEGASPSDIDTVYEACTQAGMPPLRLGCCGSFAYECRSYGDDYTLAIRRMGHYRALIDVGLRTQGLFVREETDEYETTLREFREDLALFLKTYRASPLSESLPEGWGEEASIEELCGRKTDHASKAQVLALMSSLASWNDAGESVRVVMQSGTFQRWLARLQEIPKEEERERARAEKRQREEERRKLDAEIEAYIKRGTSFSAFDVAREIGCSAKTVSGRIRTYVRRGAVVAVGNETPRIYRAA